MVDWTLLVHDDLRDWKGPHKPGSSSATFSMNVGGELELLAHPGERSWATMTIGRFLESSIGVEEGCLDFPPGKVG